MTYLWVIGAGILSLQLVNAFVPKEVTFPKNNYLGVTHQIADYASLRLKHSWYTSDTVQVEVELDGEVGLALENAGDGAYRRPLRLDVD